MKDKIKVVEKWDYTILRRGHKYMYAGVELVYSKMIAGNFRFKDTSGNPVTVKREDFCKITIIK